MLEQISRNRYLVEINILKAKSKSSEHEKNPHPAAVGGFPLIDCKC